MALPDAVKRRAEEADALINQANGNTGQDPTPDSEVKLESKGTPEPKPTPDNEAPIDFEQKFKVLQGKYNSELPVLRDQVKSLQAQLSQAPAQNDQIVNDLRGQVEKLQTEITTLQSQGQASKQSAIELNEHLKDEYGEEFAKAIQQTAQQIAGSEVAQLKQQLQDLQSSVSESQQSFKNATQDQKLSSLKSILKAEHNIDFDTIEKDPLFGQWLDQADPRSGQAIRALLQNAFHSGDMQRTASFYADYNASQPRSNSNSLDEYADPLNNNAPIDAANPQRVDPSAFTRLAQQFQRKQITREEYERKERELFQAVQPR